MKTIKKEFALIPNGSFELELGNFDDGNKYEFEINVDLKGLFGDDPDKYYENNHITISGRGYQELAVIGSMFREIANSIEKDGNVKLMEGVEDDQ